MLSRTITASVRGARTFSNMTRLPSMPKHAGSGSMRYVSQEGRLSLAKHLNAKPVEAKPAATLAEKVSQNIAYVYSGNSMMDVNPYNGDHPGEFRTQYADTTTTNVVDN